VYLVNREDVFALACQRQQTVRSRLHGAERHALGLRRPAQGAAMNTITAVVVAALLVASFTLCTVHNVRAEERRPLPVPAQGSICPSGYSNSPVSST
jgi:hypothetical protein